jgi:hypothetical protein
MRIWRNEPEVPFGAAVALPDVFQSQVVIRRMSQFLFTSQIMLGRLNRCVPKQELNLIKFTPFKWHNRAQVRRKSCGARFLVPARFAAAMTSA